MFVNGRAEQSVSFLDHLKRKPKTKPILLSIFVGWPHALLMVTPFKGRPEREPWILGSSSSLSLACFWVGCSVHV